MPASNAALDRFAPAPPPASPRLFIIPPIAAAVGDSVGLRLMPASRELGALR